MPALAAALIAAASAPTEWPTITVIGRDLDARQARAVAEIDAEASAVILPTHPAELFSRLPGSWITRGSGQEHLSAIRSPLLTGAGGCGALLILEDGIPIRPPGFCNVNNLFEVNLLQAEKVSVLRGPGGLGHASGGLHGVIDVHSRSARRRPLNRVSLEAGSNDHLRAAVALTGASPNSTFGLDANAVDAGSFRDDEGYEHQLLTLNHLQQNAWGQWRTVLSMARLDQDTAGFIFGENSFRDPVERRRNLNPEAFRRATAVRLIGRAEWQADGAETRLSLFARRSRMTFLQHFLPGQPLERNGQISAGLQLDQTRQAGNFELSWGLDAEWFSGFLFEEQAAPATGSAFLEATRPVGRHYDYEVDGQRLGGYAALDFGFADHWTVRAGVHGDWIRYAYQTALPPGNLAEDGSQCGFGGCLFNRPADRTDRFVEFAPELTLSRRLAGGLAWLRLARGFRAPQATELYRLQRGQDVADLDTEILDAVEVGLRAGGRLSHELVAFYQRKKRFIFRDAEGFNVSDGKTAHWGLEAQVDWSINSAWSLSGRASRTHHVYRFNRDLGGETILSGRTIASAPRWLAGADLDWRPPGPWRAQLAFELTGGYWLDALNTRRYPGHSLWHAGIARTVGKHWQVSVRIRNLLGRRYAERADFAFGNFRYFPGAGRRLLLSLSARFD